MIYGRDAEQAELDRLLAEATNGRSAALVIRGEPGIGKSTLLDYVSDRASASGVPVLRCVGIETEAELPYAALHLLLRPYLRQMDALPKPQAMALRAAFGLTDLPAGDRFLAGVGVLTLLSDLAEAGPLLIVIDDAQWVDRSSAGALLFAARRLDAEGVVMLFAARDHGQTFREPGLPELRLSGLDQVEATALLARLAPELAPQVRARVLEEAAGNPLALLELPGALTGAQRTGWMPSGAGTVATAPGSGRVRQAFLDQLHNLPEPCQLLLLVAAADDTGDLGVLSAAAARLGVSLSQLEPAEAGGMVQILNGSIGFRHPLIRSATYQGAPVGRRVAVHRALADTYADQAEPDRRAWHLAAGAVGPDASVATLLERSAERARARGGHAAVAAAYQRAAGLTPDPAHRTRRLAAAARAAAAAGLPELAEALVSEASPQTTDPSVGAELVRVLHALGHEQDQSCAIELVRSASAIAEPDPETAALMVVEAMTSSWAAADQAATAAVADAVAQMPDPATPSRFLAGAKTAAIHLAGGELRQAMPQLRKLLEQFAGSAHEVSERVSIMGWYDLLVPCAQAHHEAAALVRDCRAEGAIGLLPRALMYLARALLRHGRYLDACTAGGEGLRIAQDTNQPHFAGHLRGLLACVAAIEGEEERFQSLTDGLLAHGLTEKGVECLHASNLRDLGLGQPEAVLDRWDRLAVGSARHIALGMIATLPDYVEAAVRVGVPERADEPYRRLLMWAEATDLPWAKAVALRCRALLADGDSAGDWYEEAGKTHTDDDQPFDRARTSLLYGGWLRRRLLRNAARPHLRTAVEIFERLGAEPWAEQARTELRASGEAHEVGERGADLLDRMTPQELQVVRLAAAGMSNREIGAQLFLSPRTVGYHLYKAYPKLGVASRGDLRRLDLG